MIRARLLAFPADGRGGTRINGVLDQVRRAPFGFYYLRLLLVVIQGKDFGAKVGAGAAKDTEIFINHNPTGHKLLLTQ
jgi:hypothetical protein